MDSRNDIREFLATRRARITPQQAGLASYGRRRVPGLRREEVAVLAGVSTDYYAQLERGNLTGVSDSVLDAIARALQLDEAEHAHLHDLARAANTTPHSRRRPAPKQQIRPVVQRILDGMTALPAIVLNGRLDLLAANRLGVALYSPVYACRPVPAGEPGEVRLSQPTGNRALPELGRRGQHHRRHAAHRSRPQPLRPRPVRPHR